MRGSFGSNWVNRLNCIQSEEVLGTQCPGAGLDGTLMGPPPPPFVHHFAEALFSTSAALRPSKFVATYTARNSVER